MDQLSNNTDWQVLALALRVVVAVVALVGQLVGNGLSDLRPFEIAQHHPIPF